MTTPLPIEAEIMATDQQPDVTTALATVPSVSDALVLQRDPEIVLAEATKAAKALMAVMDQKPHKVMMNGEQYLENEDWLTIGHFYGVTAQIESDKFVEFGDVRGWEATAILVSRDCRVLGRCTAMCLNDEEKWSSRPKKEWAYCLGTGDCGQHEHSVEDPGYDRLVWEPNPAKPGKNKPKKARITTGEEKVPFFQLRSMAQTRASSKVHSSVLRFVPVLAGFKATPAEELPDSERVDNIAQAPAPPREREKPAAVPVEDRGQSSDVVDVETGEVLPPGFALIDDYKPDGDWHQVWWSRDDNGGSLKWSTKKSTIGNKCREAYNDRVPVKLYVTDRGYIDKVEMLGEQPKPKKWTPAAGDNVDEQAF